MRRLVVIQFALFSLLLQGCATVYEASRTEQADGRCLTSMRIVSYREFPEGVEIRYNRESGSFEFSAQDVQTQDNAADAAAALLQGAAQILSPHP